MTSTEIIPANSILFKDLCVVLEKLDKAKSKEQEDILEKFINEIKLGAANSIGKKNSSIFPILRLLLPECEKRAYNLKELKLGGLLVKVLSLSKQTHHAQKLLNYRSQNVDFSSAAYFVLKNVGMCHKSGCLNIGDVNDALDRIANAEIGNKQCDLDETFSYIIRNTTELQMKWFLKIVLKKLKIRMTLKHILNVFHPDAYEFYESCSNLSKVCKEFEDGNARSPEMGIRLLLPVSPMLSDRLDVTKVSMYLHPNKTYQIENKFDGERFQMHMQEGVFEYFSRRGYPFSDKYGKTYESGFLTPYLKDCFSPSVTSFILDGEMMGWNKEKQMFGSKGMSYDIKKISENSKYRPCFCVYDLLYYNGKSLGGAPDKGGMPLRERLKILDAMFKDKRGVIQHSERKEVKGSSDILEALNEAIDMEKEGIVVKDVDSYYMANKRNAGWYKIKPEYTESTMTDLDLVIIGADEAQDKSSGRANSFHVACADTTQPGVSPHRWVCVGRVSTGLTNEQRERLNKALEPHWVLTKTTPPPDSLYFNKKKPDLWVTPQHSCILQVRATELVRSKSFGAAYTLRFPRVERVRDDKRIEDTMTLQELNGLVDSKNPVNKLSKTQIGQDQITHTVITTSRKRTAKVMQVAESFKSKRCGDVEVVSRALLGRKVCVVSDDEDCRKMELVKIVESHAGKHSEDTGDVWCCIVGRRTQRARNLITTETNDILTTTWLRSLPPSDTPCQITPLDALALKQETMVNMCMDYDSYGDSYRKPTDNTTLKRCFDKMDDSGIEMYLTNQEMMNLDKELFGDDDHNPLSFLRLCFIHALNYDIVNSILARVHGATLCAIDSPDLTHLVVPRDTKREVIEHMKDFTNGVIVYEDWLEACLDNKKLVPDDKYKL